MATREELEAALAELDDDGRIEVRGVEVHVNKERVRSWQVISKIAAMQKAEGLEGITMLMDVVCDVCGLEEEDVLDMAGGHYADVVDVAEVLKEISEAAFPKN